MSDGAPLGFDPVEGRFFPVQASVAPRYGRGAVLGLAVGAAVGELAPGSRLAAEAPLPVSADAPLVLHLAAELTGSLMRRGRLVTADLIDRIGIFAVDPRLAPATRTALGLIGHGVPAATVGERMWTASGRPPGDAHALWAAVPVGLFYAGVDDHLLPSALDVMAWSHADPRCRLAAAAVAAAIAAGARDGAAADAMCVAAIDGVDRGAQRLIDDAPAAAGDGIEAAHATIREELARAFDDAGDAEAEVGRPTPPGDAVGETLRAVFHHLYRESPPPTLVAELAGTGHVAALAGALLGAALGDDTIPAAWRAAVTPSPEDDDTVMGQLLAMIPSADGGR